MNLLALHELIAGTGDGLHPDLLRVLEERARIEFDPAVASLAAKTGAGRPFPIRQSRVIRARKRDAAACPTDHPERGDAKPYQGIRGVFSCILQ